jgi:hypothetical protein
LGKTRVYKIKGVKEVTLLGVRTEMIEMQELMVRRTLIS